MKFAGYNIAKGPCYRPGFPLTACPAIHYRLFMCQDSGWLEMAVPIFGTDKKAISCHLKSINDGGQKNAVHTSGTERHFTHAGFVSMRLQQAI
jgi:hypothetical protein